MLRFLSAVLMVWAVAVQADEFESMTAPQSVVLFPGFAEVTRGAELDLPQGRHQLILLGVPEDAQAMTVDVTGADVLTLRRGAGLRAVPEGAALVAARANLLRVEQEMARLNDEIAGVRASAEAAASQLRFLDRLGEGSAFETPEFVKQLTEMVGHEAQFARVRQIDAEAQARTLAEGLPALERAREDAVLRLEEASNERRQRAYVVLELDVAQAGGVTVDLRYFDYRGSWEPSYAFELQTEPEVQLTLKRGVRVMQNTGENWRDVALTLSTQLPGAQNAPSDLYPLRRRIEAPQQARNFGKYAADALAEPIMEAPVVVESAEGFAVQENSVGVTYHLSHPVSVKSGGEQVEIALDVRSLPARLSAVAVPLRDTQAYRVVEVENTLGEHLLSARNVGYFVDGTLVSFADFAALPVGAEATLGFGPIRGIALKRDVIAQNEGDRGVISRQNLQEQQVEIEVINQTTRAWELRLIDRVPYGEQEDLEITWQAEPRASVENLDKQRGILAWDLTLDVGAKQVITLEHSLRWPEGMVLR